MELAILGRLFGSTTTVIKSFPGTLPVSISRADLSALQSGGYVFSPKLDGTRFLLFIYSVPNQQWWSIYSREETVVQLEETLIPWSEVTDVSVFDVEGCRDMEENWTFYIFDALMVRNILVHTRSYEIRMEHARQFIHTTATMIVAPRGTWWWETMSAMIFPTSFNICSYLHHHTRHRLVVKPFFEYRFLSSFRSFLEQGSRFDGIVFMLLFDKYRIFRSSMTSCMKFKPYHQITIDVCVTRQRCRLTALTDINSLWTMDTIGSYILYIPMGKMKNMICFARTDDVGSLSTFKDGDVGEFKWKQGCWTLVHWRQKAPNSLSTVVATIQNLMDVIYLDDLLKI